MLRGSLVGLLLAFSLEVVYVLVGNNFHPVIPGRCYRCSQPSAAWLAQAVRRKGIRTVVNLRGSCPSMNWYIEECRTAAELDVNQEDLCFSAGRMPSVSELRRLVDVLDHSEYPLLLHCQRGADRTGLAAAVVLLLQTDLPFAQALSQLSPRFGHIPMGRPAYLDRFFTLYQEWLQAHSWQHTPAHFRQWAKHDYCPGACRARLEPLVLPSEVRSGEPFACRVRCHNTSIKTWRLRPGSNTGIHLVGYLTDGKGQGVAIDRCGLFEAEVAPCESIDLTLVLVAPKQPGCYRGTLDMVDETHCCFAQVGSALLEWELEVREQETPAVSARFKITPQYGRVARNAVNSCWGFFTEDVC
jgi:hypothetical protein